MTTTAADRRVPGFLGRILDGDTLVGTCFQAAAGVLVTAWHVLDDLGAGTENAQVRVDALAGGLDPVPATVVRIDPVHDLAVLTCATALPASVARWAATDWIALNTEVVVTGVPEVDDPGRSYRHLDAPGTWAGGTTRDLQVPLGRLTSSAVTRGMSGAAVRRVSDDVVVGVVSARYNSADGWLTHSVWAARVEDLQPLLDGICGIEPIGRPRLGAAADLTLTVTDDTVRLHGAGVDVTAAHRGMRPGLSAAVGDVHRERTRIAATGPARATGAEPAQIDHPGSVSLRRTGDLLAAAFLPDPVAEALAAVIRHASAAHVPVRLGVEAGAFAVLPWEAVPDPVTHRPLALHPLLTVYRRAQAASVRPIPGPLRIVVAIAAPDEGGGPVLDYEHELRNVLAAVRAARQGEADVRIVPFATTAALRAELDRAPAHVLHLSGHGVPGALIVEDEGGAARAVTADQLVDEAIPPGAMPPVISLAACYTDAPAAEDAPSFAANLLTRGAGAVIATETSVTDRYATALFARLYQELAQSAVPDVVAALADARRIVHRQLSASPHPRDRQIADLDEWSVVTVLAATGSTVVFDPATVEPIPAPPRSAVGGLLTRGVGDFVGRRREQRTLPAMLTDGRYAGVVLHGIGGVGKTTLAGQLVQRRHPAIVVTPLMGELTVDAVLTAVAAALRRQVHLGDYDPAEQKTLLRAAGYAAGVDEPWRERLAMLREYLFDRIPLLLVLDNFEDNLTAAHEVVDPALAELLAAWVVDPGRSRLLITSRYRFFMPDDAHTRLWFQQVGPLSRAETFKLIWSLPALDRLEDRELETVWRLVGGHPRSLEYLDALLNHGSGRFADITARLTNALDRNPNTRSALTADGLDAALAATVTLVADDILLDELLAGLDPIARNLLLGASVYREPVPLLALLFQIGTDDPTAERTPDPDALSERVEEVLTRHGLDPEEELDTADLPAEALADLQSAYAEGMLPHPALSTDADLGTLVTDLAGSSLLTVDPASGTVFVHRWTATELADRSARNGDDELRRCHTRAANYWRWRVQVWPQDRDADLHDLLEVRHHLLEAGDIDAATRVTEAICRRLHTIGAWDHETTLIHDTLTRLDPESSRRAGWYHALGMIAQDRGDYTEAERQYTASLTIDEELGNRAGMASSYHHLGILAQHRGDYAEAERQYTRALTLFEEVGNRAGIATSSHQFGILAQLRGDYTEAERQYTASLAIEEELGDRAGMANSYHQLGILAQLRGDYDEAERQYTASLTIEEEVGNRSGMATTWSALGNLASAREQPDDAVQWHIMALFARADMGLPEVKYDAVALSALRDRLGRDRFRVDAAALLENDDIADLDELLDSLDSP